MNAARRLLTGISTVLVTACLPGSTSPISSLSAGPAATIVEVTNNNFEDLVVYWRKGDVDIPLGVSNGMTTRRFVVSQVLLGDGLGLQLAIGPRGQRASQVSTLFDMPQRATASWIVDYRAGLTTVVVK